MVVEVKIWLKDTAGGSLIDSAARMLIVPRVGETLSIRGWRYQVSQIIHEETPGPKCNDGTDWRIHVVVADMGPS